MKLPAPLLRPVQTAVEAQIFDDQKPKPLIWSTVSGAENHTLYV